MASDYISDASSKSMSQLLAYHEMMNKYYGAPSQVDKVLSEQDKEDRLAAEEQRKSQAATDLSSYRQSLSQEAQQRMGLAQQTFEKKYGTGGFEEQKSTREQQKAESLINLQDAERRRNEAETGEATARTGLVTTQNDGARIKNEKALTDAQVAVADRHSNRVVQMAVAGQPIDKDTTDQYEKDQRYLTGNDKFTVDRNPDGSWKYDPNKIALMTTNKDGTPNATFARGARDAEKPYDQTAQLVDDIRRAKSEGWSPEQIDILNQKLRKTTAMLPNQIEGEMIQKLADNGAPDLAIQVSQEFGKPLGGDKPRRMPAASEQTNMRQTMNLIGDLQASRDKLIELTNNGIIASGKMHEPYQRVLQEIEAQDPEVAKLYQDLNIGQSQYITMMHSRRAAVSPEAIKYINDATPNKTDSVIVMKAKLDNMIKDLVHAASVDNGLFEMNHLQTYDGIPKINPMQALREDGFLPPIETDKSYMSNQMVENHVRMIAKLGEMYKKQNIAGPGAFRTEGQPAASPSQTSMVAPSAAPTPRQGVAPDFPSANRGTVQSTPTTTTAGQAPLYVRPKSKEEIKSELKTARIREKGGFDHMSDDELRAEAERLRAMK